MKKLSAILVLFLLVPLCCAQTGTQIDLQKRVKNPPGAPGAILYNHSSGIGGSAATIDAMGNITLIDPANILDGSGNYIAYSSIQLQIGTGIIGEGNQCAWSDVTNSMYCQDSLGDIIQWYNGAVIIGDAGHDVCSLGSSGFVCSTQASFASTITAPALIENTSSSPASAGTAGTTGQIAWDANYIYICIQGGVAGSATWKKAALGSD
jgi:hypothetical protein